MIDAHIHIEKSPYTIDWINEYVRYAQERGLSEINLLEHTHRFTEWMPLYETSRKKDPLAAKWVDDHITIPIQDYYDFIQKAREYNFPIKVNFGLEVCYFPDKNKFIKDMLNEFDFDFVVGSVHYAFDVPYDIKGLSEKILWDKYPVDDIYEDYFDRCMKCVESGLFSQLGHPDTIKMFDSYKPSIDTAPLYEKLADSLHRNNVMAENNVGCYYRYGHPDMGLSDDVLKIFKDKGVKIITASDAHKPEHVGMYIKEITNK